MPNHFLATYGTLRKGFSNNYLLGDALYIGRGLTQAHYQMKVNRILPFVNKTPDVQIVVDVYEVSEHLLLTHLDRLENHPVWYKRELIEVEVVITNEMATTEPLMAWLYFCDEGNEIVPSGDYANVKRLQK